MESSLYDAGSQSEVGVVRQHIDEIEIQTTASGNTSLHLADQFGELECASVILEVRPSLLGQVNNEGETPLHMAAREGNADKVKELIECAKRVKQEHESGLGGVAEKMLRAPNAVGDTALHIAVQKFHLKETYLEVIRLLTEEDIGFEYPANNNEETPLYLAAERGILDVVVMLLKTQTPPAYDGPSGRTALHAATFNLKDGVLILKELLHRYPHLVNELDAYGWTPLHSAARCGNVEAVKKLLESDKSLAYVAANGDEGNTALHIAAALGDVSVMDEILSYCPDCWEMVNSKGQNILHIAAYYERDLDLTIATDFILQRPGVARHLINQKDNEGNTPLHILDECPGADKRDVNYETLTPADEVNSKAWPRPIHMYNGRHILKKDRERIMKWKMIREEREKKKRKKEERKKEGKEEMAKTHMIIATLIATISFATSFTIPGGYHVEGPDEGMAVLVRDAAFRVFVISNTIAVMCSTSSIILYLSASILKLDDKEYQKVEGRYMTAFTLVLYALLAITIAFITGTYAVLGQALGLAIPTFVIGCFSFVVYYDEVSKYVKKWALKILKE